MSIGRPGSRPPPTAARCWCRTATGGLVGDHSPQTALRDLGEFRLKDLERPERLIQLVGAGLADDFPAPRTLEAPSNLPPQVTSFVGREREIGEVSELVRHSRLVTLTGPGGTGKTRLSLRVAEELRPEFPGGAFFVDLSPISDPGLIPTTIAQAIGLREDPKQPVAELLEAHLRDLRLLLVLDNFEQLVGGAPLVGRLLAAAPHLTVLATSREVLHLRGEQEYPVPPLGVPDPGPCRPWRRSPSTTPWPCSSSGRGPCGRTSGRRAERLGGRRHLCPPGRPSAGDRAGGRPHQGVRAGGDPGAPGEEPGAPDEQRARRSRTTAHAPRGDRLELRPAGGTERTLPAAGHLRRWLHDRERRGRLRSGRRAGRRHARRAGLPRRQEPAPTDPISQGEPRFRMLETIREYGLERLAESAENETVRHRHEDQFAALARRAEPELVGARPKEWLDRLEMERDNLRAAIQRAADDGRIELALDMAAALWRFWQQRGHLVEGRETLRGLLDRPEAAGRTGARARALGGLGGVAYWQADIAGAGQAYEEALEIERELDDPSGLAGALYNAGFVAALTGDHAGARARYDEAIRIYEAIGDRKGLVNVREALAFILYHSGDFAAARAVQEENLAALRNAGETFRIASALSLLSGINLKDHAFAAAHESLGEAIGLFRQAGDMQRIVSLLIMAAALAVAEGDPKGAALLSGAAAR